jgi:DNA-binding XRE family transcriptional regulator
MSSDLSEREPLQELPLPSERLRLRQLFGVTQEELAKSVGVTRRTLGSWERGDSEPTGNNRADYAALLSAWAETERNRKRRDDAQQKGMP